jgi:hypothetical protein
MQLVYHASSTSNKVKMNETIRNTIGEAMRVAAIPFGNLEDVAVLVHCLSCYMHYNNVIALLRVISERMLLEGSPLTPSRLDCELPTDRLWK